MALQKDGRSFKGDPFCKRGHPKVFGKDCKECNRLRCLKWTEANHEYQLKKHREYYAENGDEMRAKMRERYHSTPELREDRNAYHRSWTDKNREHVKAYYRELYAADPIGRGKAAKAWKIANRDVWRALNNESKNRRRARIKDSLGSHALAEWNAILL